MNVRTTTNQQLHNIEMSIECGMHKGSLLIFITNFLISAGIQQVRYDIDASLLCRISDGGSLVPVFAVNIKTFAD